MRRCHAGAQLVVPWPDAQSYFAGPQADLGYMRTCLAEANPPVERACLFPRYEQLALFAEQHPGASFADALEAFAARYGTESAGETRLCISLVSGVGSVLFSRRTPQAGDFILESHHTRS